MTSASKALALLAAALVFAAPAAAELAVPPLAARVTDLTSTLKPAEREALEAKLAAFEAKKGSQIAVLVVPSTQPEAIEQYSIRVVDQWKLGRKGVDDGVLLLVAKDDRRLRIEVGRGLEGAVPDAAARRIVAEYITPRFKAGDYAGGIDAGVDRLIAVIGGEPLPEPQESWTSGSMAADEMGWLNLLFIGIVVLVFLNGVLRAFLGRAGAAGVVGGVIGILLWVVLSAVAVAVVGAVIAFIVSLLMGAGGSRASGGWRSGGGGWSSGGGGGGFSGGGGGFSGGGSSGSW